MAEKTIDIIQLKHPESGEIFYPQTHAEGVIGLGTAATTDSTAYATATQGSHADSAYNLVIGNKNVNTVLAGPSSGSAGAASFRKLVAADIPNLDWSKITSGKPTTIAGYGITDAKFGMEGTDYIPVTLGSITKNVLTVHQSLANYLSRDGGSMNNTNVVTNLNADLLDGQHSSYYAAASSLADYVTLASNQTITGTKTISTSKYGEQLIIKRNELNYDAVIRFENARDGLLGYIGIRGSINNKVPAYGDGTNVYTLYHSGNLSLATLSGSSAIGSSTQPIYYNGLALVACDLSTTYAPYNSAGYLPLSGGTMTGSLTINNVNANFTKNIKFGSTTDWARSIVEITVDGISKFNIGAFGTYTTGASDNGINYAYIGVNSYSGINLRFGSDSTLKWGANTIWHSGNSNLSTVDWTAKQMTANSFKLASGTPTLTWDATNSAWHLSGNFYADGFVSAGGWSDGSGTSGIDWDALATNDSSHKIDVSHIPNITTSKITDLESWISEKGYVTSSGITSIVKGTATSGGAVSTSGGTVTIQFPTAYSLPIAKSDTLGGIKVGSGLSINATTGVLSATYSYTLPTASASTLGGIKVGSGLAITDAGVLSATYSYTLPLAANGTRGGIQIGYAESGTNYAVKLSSEKAYVTVPWTDTKNTAGSTDTSSKIFLIGATSQAANPQTYSDNEVYVTSGTLTTNKVQIGGTAVTVQYNSTDKCVEFIFN